MLYCIFYKKSGQRKPRQYAEILEAATAGDARAQADVIGAREGWFTYSLHEVVRKGA